MFLNHRQKERIATIGGTFDTLHAGHKEYIQLAFEFADRVWIYVSSDEFASGQKKYPVQPYEIRLEKLLEHLHQTVEHGRYQIRRLHGLGELQKDYLEAAELRDKIYAAIVSPEYYDYFQNLNCLREIRGLRSFLTVVKRRTLTKDKHDLSSYEVRKRLPVNGKHLIVEAEPEALISNAA